MFECKLSVTDYSVFIGLEKCFMKIFPKDYGKFTGVLLLALRKQKTSFVVNNHVVFWYDDGKEKSAFTTLCENPTTEYVTDNQVREIIIKLLEAEALIEGETDNPPKWELG